MQLQAGSNGLCTWSLTVHRLCRLSMDDRERILRGLGQGPLPVRAAGMGSSTGTAKMRMCCATLLGLLGNHPPALAAFEAAQVQPLLR